MFMVWKGDKPLEQSDNLGDVAAAKVEPQVTAWWNLTAWWLSLGIWQILPDGNLM